MFDMNEQFRRERAQERANEAYRRAREREYDRQNRFELWKLVRVAIVIFLIYMALQVIGLHPLLAIPVFLVAMILIGIIAVVWFIKKLWHWDVR